MHIILSCLQTTLTDLTEWSIYFTCLTGFVFTIWYNEESRPSTNQTQYELRNVTTDRERCHSHTVLCWTYFVIKPLRNICPPNSHLVKLDRKLSAWNYFELKPTCNYRHKKKRVNLCSKLSDYKLKALSISTWKSVKYKPLQLQLAN